VGFLAIWGGLNGYQPDIRLWVGSTSVLDSPESVSLPWMSIIDPEAVSKWFQALEKDFFLSSKTGGVDLSRQWVSYFFALIKVESFGIFRTATRPDWRKIAKKGKFYGKLAFPAKIDS
jgi:hypothetical protein